MVVTIVHVWIKPGTAEKFIEASVENHQKSIKESGNLRFDLLQDAMDENKFVFYEAYESDEAAAAHKETVHYKNWRDTVAEMMAKPRKGEKHIIICPTDKALW
jgi:(4S)-4-hydroxy-5-phosphonooxypentane-2,3-dione isomerase